MQKLVQANNIFLKTKILRLKNGGNHLINKLGRTIFFSALLIK